MTAVLGLIQELADFEKEPDAVLITVDDLVRDGFGLYFMSCGSFRDYQVLYYRYSTWKGKTIHLEDLVVKEKCVVQEPVMLCIQKLSNKVKDQVRRVEWNVLDWNTPIDFMKIRAKVLRDWYVVQMDEEVICKIS
jgi:hypothetical protein